MPVSRPPKRGSEIGDFGGSKKGPEKGSVLGAQNGQKSDFKMSRLGELLSTQRNSSKIGFFRVFVGYIDVPPKTPKNPILERTPEKSVSKPYYIPAIPEKGPPGPLFGPKMAKSGIFGFQAPPPGRGFFAPPPGGGKFPPRGGPRGGPKMGPFWDPPKWPILDPLFGGHFDPLPGGPGRGGVIPDLVYVARHARRFGWDVMQPLDLDPSNGVAARR